MRKLLFLMAIIAGVVLQAQTLQVVITQDKKDQRYQISEPVKFHISVVDKAGKNVPGQVVEYRFTGDGGVDDAGKITSADKPVDLTATINVSGFLRLNAKLAGSKKSVDSGAAFEPEKIVSSTPYPADFDAFWANELKLLRERSKNMKIMVTPAPTPERWAAKWNSFDVRLEDGVINATGTLIIPKNAKPKSLPIVMCFFGASKIGGYATYIYKNYDCISFIMNLHDTKNIVTKPEIAKLRKRADIRNYQYRSPDSAAEYGTGIIFRRVLRCKDYLKSLPEWDGKNVIVRGSSMGGAQSIVAAYNDPDVKLCVAGAPAMCNHFGVLNNQFSGWPRLFSHPALVKNVDLRSKAEKVMPYFDIVNFARGVKCPVIMSVGFIDYVCAPTSVYAAYNALGATNKVIHEVPMGNHGTNFDKSPGRVPGVFGYGGNEVHRLVRKMVAENAKAVNQDK